MDSQENMLETGRLKKR